MTAKEYLSQAFYINQRINSKLQQIEDLKLLATKVTAVISDLPKNPTKNTNGLSETVTKILELEQEVSEDIDQLLKLKREITQVIERVPKSEYRLLLEKRYLHCERWEKIAVELDHSIQHIYRIHSAALNSAGKYLPQKKLRANASK